VGEAQNAPTRKLYSLLLKAAEDFATKGIPKGWEVEATMLIDLINETKDEVQREVHRLVSDSLPFAQSMD